MIDLKATLLAAGARAAAGLAFIAVIGLSIVAVSSAFERLGCQRYATISGKTTDYSVYTGCLVRTSDGRWVALRSLTRNSADVTIRGAKR